MAEFETKKTASEPFNPLAGDLDNIGDGEILRRAMQHFNADLSAEAKCAISEFSGM